MFWSRFRVNRVGHIVHMDSTMVNMDSVGVVLYQPGTSGNIVHTVKRLLSAMPCDGLVQSGACKVPNSQPTLAELLRCLLIPSFDPSHHRTHPITLSSASGYVPAQQSAAVVNPSAPKSTSAVCRWTVSLDGGRAKKGHVKGHKLGRSSAAEFIWSCSVLRNLANG